MIKVEQLPVLNDNYIYLITDDILNDAAVIDPAIAQPVINYLEKHNLNLTHIFITHHHADHIGGIHKLLEKYPNAQVYGSQYDKGRIPHQKHFLNHLNKVTFLNYEGIIYANPGHTLGHIAYYFNFQNNSYLFSGDALFCGGCGRVYEGSYEQMFQSLKILKENISDQTLVCCAHEYTVKNYSVLLQLEPQNEKIQNKLKHFIELRNKNIPTVPFLFGEDKQTNSLLRWDDLELKTITQTSSDLDTFTAIRKFRNGH